MKRSAFAALVAAGLIVTTALPAAAADRSGFRTCGVNHVVGLATITGGNTAVHVDGWHETKQLPTSSARNWRSTVRSGSWGVSAPTLTAASASCVL